MGNKVAMTINRPLKVLQDDEASALADTGASEGARRATGDAPVSAAIISPTNSGMEVVPRGRRFFSKADKQRILQAADRCHANDPADVERTQRVNIGPVIYFMRENSVAPAMPWQKIYLAAAYFSANERVRRRAKRRVDLVFARLTHLFHLIQTAATDDPDGWRLLFHARRDLIRKIDNMGSG